jgi:subtilisin family serine protease
MIPDIICPNCHSVTPPWRYCKVCNAHIDKLIENEDKESHPRSESRGLFGRSSAETGCEFKAPMDARLHKSLDQIRRHNIRKLATSSTGEDEVAVIAKVLDLENLETLTKTLGEGSIKAKIRGAKVAAKGADEGQTPMTSCNPKDKYEWIVTARLKESEVESLCRQPFVVSLKGQSRFRPFLEKTLSETCADQKLLPKDEKTDGGKGVIIGIVDFGLDFAHRNFRNNFRNDKDSTRVLALWDQKALPRTNSEQNKFGYGRVFTSEEITKALKSGELDKSDSDTPPYEKFGYLLPKDSLFETGAHGTYVADIAAGNGSGTHQKGVAPNADIVFVDLVTAPLSEPPAIGSTFGDSAQLLEAIQFIFDFADKKDCPCVVNLSIGSNDGPHDGTTLVEEAIDWLVSEKHNRAVVVAAGNTFDEALHATGQVCEEGTVDLKWRIPEYDATRNEIELWYPGEDRFRVEILDPDGKRLLRVNPGEYKSYNKRGLLTVYNILGDPGNGDNVINVFFEHGLREGDWTLRLYGKKVCDGRFHAWIERDERGQSRFAPPEDGSYEISYECTLSSLACGKRSIVVGAYDAHSLHPKAPISESSSSGPTRDRRRKPDISAPGELVLAAQSGTLVLRHRQSGTSMAAAAVTGIVALMLAEARALGLSLTADQIRNILILASHNHPPESEDWDERYGWGRVCAAKAVALVSAMTFKCGPMGPRA